MAELGKLAQDYEAAAVDFQKVIGLCEQYPEKNTDTLTSAVFAFGKMKLDICQFEDSKKLFERAALLLTEKLIAQMKGVGKEFELATVTTAELLQDSIFDTDSIKDTKMQLREL